MALLSLRNSSAGRGLGSSSSGLDLEDSSMEMGAFMYAHATSRCNALHHTAPHRTAPHCTVAQTRDPHLQPPGLGMAYCWPGGCVYLFPVLLLRTSRRLCTAVARECPGSLQSSGKRVTGCVTQPCTLHTLVPNPKPGNMFASPCLPLCMACGRLPGLHQRRSLRQGHPGEQAYSLACRNPNTRLGGRQSPDSGA